MLINMNHAETDPGTRPDELRQDATLVQLPGFIRLIVAGRDRAKYLHNFCTNNVKALAVGQWCEAFFTDVKAKILAHGWILAGTDRHEIWMLPGDESAILKHLQKYVITEDVTITSETANSSTFALPGSQADAGLLACGVTASILSAGAWGDVELKCGEQLVAATILTTVWATVPLTLCRIAVESANPFIQMLASQGRTIGDLPAFERIRISERFPIIGVDMTSENLAPEAQRDSTAISYVKGCYLGQEPIARLDAMGHVNRALRSFHISATVEQCRDATIYNSGGTMIGTFTSVCSDTVKNSSVGLSVVRVHGVDLSSGVVVRTAGQEQIAARII